MIEEYEKQRRNQLSQMRTITNYGMGVVFLCAGILFLFYQQAVVEPHWHLDILIGI